jgi:acetyl-CoA carboxylase carboxyl transferase subunit alpha
VPKKISRLKSQDGAQPSAWERVQLARHPQRPYTLDYLQLTFTEFVELHGDRRFGDDAALVGGMAVLEERTVMVIGHQKGRDTKENLLRRFGMVRPEGYRKALRLMMMAERFRIPVVTLIDTPGAYPGVGAEQRGQSGAIARSQLLLMGLNVPVVACVIGEGSSGGALAIGVADRVLMQQHSIYTVISPEGCAAILWKDAGEAKRAATALRPTAPACLALGVIDQIVPEPGGGAHRDHAKAADMLGDAIAAELEFLDTLPPLERRRLRRQKFERMGAFLE